MQEIFNIKFRHQIGTTCSLRFLKHPFSGLSAEFNGFVELGPFADEAHGGIREAVAACVNRKVGIDIPIAFRIIKKADSTTEEQIRRDFYSAFSYAYDFADFFVLDFSDKSMGAVLDPLFIRSIVDPILDARLSYDDYRPIVVRLCTGIHPQDLNTMLDYFLMNNVDAVELSDTEQIKAVLEFSGGRLPIIANTSSSDKNEVVRLLKCGASLVNVDIKNTQWSRIRLLFKTFKLRHSKHA